MSMPKGFKKESGYATVTGMGMGYREIADTLTVEGSPMNHATARNYFLRAMNKLAKQVANHTTRAPKEIALDPRFQSAVAELLRK
jgi:hypothetical protein